jgi:16S rRNA (guanine527-N7)-methyltransferase
MTESGLHLAQANVSRETKAQLDDLANLLVKWNSTINLISKSTIAQIWLRHILDSMQIFNLGATANLWADLGSGGGFPGLVVAVLAKEKAPHMQIVLVESDQRKATFLRQASQTLRLNTRVLPERIEAIAPLMADVVSARALAPLPQLCSFAALHLRVGGKAIFLKGKSAAVEIDAAHEDWTFTLESYASVTDSGSSVLVLQGIAHV